MKAHSSAEDPLDPPEADRVTFVEQRQRLL
jgi:hypothetical protein